MSVKLVWATPDGDNLIAYMARVSAPENQDQPETAAKLIGYLLKNKHFSPFEMCNMCVEVNTTRDIGRQLLRHKSLCFQEWSQRYADVSKLEKAQPREARMQDRKNRQNSIDTDDETLKAWWQDAQADVLSVAETRYREALDRGIAKEVARAVLPEGLTSSRLYINGSVRSWLHFCDLRMGHGTQREAVAVATDIYGILKDQFPAVCSAFEAHMHTD